MIHRANHSRPARWLILTIGVAATIAGYCTVAQAEGKTDDFKTLTVEQATEIVTQHKGTLSFRNVSEVDLAVARVLSQYKGELRLNGLKRLTPEVALALSDQPKGANLCLNALTELSPATAKALATRPGGMLSLNALPEVSPQLARELSNVRAKLTLNGVTKLSVESAHELAKHRSKLTLTGMPEISDQAGEALSVHRGTFLLNGLTRLTSPVLVQSLLKKSDGFVGFQKVRTMTEEVGKVFAAYEGRKPIALDSLTHLPRASAAKLRTNKNIVLPSHLREPGITNSLGMRLAYIPAGKFGMGSPNSEPKREMQEKRHEVVLTKDFYLGAHEVTVGQFRVFIRETGYVTEATKDGKGSWGIESTGKFVKDAKYNWMNTGFKQSENHPVVNVSWNDAKAFCQWLSKKEKTTYRLPTEAEWEYACRARTRTAYSFGDDPQDLSMVGNVADATARKAFKAWSLGIKGSDGFAFSAPVGQFKPNRFGLYDMHGNVWEWCEDWYDPKGYSGKRQTDPTGPATGERKVHRGGGWSSASNRCRSASRIGRHHTTYRGCYLGFRVARVAEKRTASTSSGSAVASQPNPRTIAARDPKLNENFDYLVYDLGKSVELRFVKVKAKGVTFTIGSSAKEQELVAKRYFGGKRPSKIDSENAHVVKMTDDFYMGQCEVTRAQFRRFIEETKYATETERTDGGYGWNEKLKKFEGRDRKYSWQNTGIPSQSDKHPVTNITRNDARAFCNWLAQQGDGKGRPHQVRLPSEAEWEFACRAGSRSRFSFGDDEERLVEYANVSDGSRKKSFPKVKALNGDDGFVFMSPVGQFKPNAFGLYDMHGNAWEWCEDYFGKYSALPKTGNGLQTSNQGERRPVMRGGAWYVGPGDCRCAKRWLVGIGGRYGSGGFRVVCIP